MFSLKAKRRLNEFMIDRLGTIKEPVKKCFNSLFSQISKISHLQKITQHYTWIFNRINVLFSFFINQCKNQSIIMYRSKSQSLDFLITNLLPLPQHPNSNRNCWQNILLKVIGIVLHLFEREDASSFSLK